MFTEFIELVRHQVSNNQIFVGMVGSSIAVSLIWLLKEVPKKIWNILVWQFTCSITIFNEDDIFKSVNSWLSDFNKTLKYRNIRVQSHYVDGENIDKITPGLGVTYFWYKGYPIRIHRTRPDKLALGGHNTRPEDIELKTIGHNPKILNDLIKEVEIYRNRNNADYISIYNRENDYRWENVCNKPLRKPDSIFLKQGQLERILIDIDKFINNKQKYQSLGIPWRRGYLFEGVPGSGKTSTIMCLASYLKRNIYTLNLNSLKDDKELVNAINDVPSKSIILIEDIDAINSSEDRIKNKNDNNVKLTNDNRTISLTGMLNAIDGVLSKEGRILIMTSNHPENLDPALIRPGRIDVREHFDVMGEDEVVRMCKRFGVEFNQTYVGLPASTVQEKLLLELN